tara:strand:- start:117 stop:2768 length:2652 start_codon:yes stop_codon:yes gene_type:complete
MKKGLIILLVLSFCGGSNELTQNESTSNQVTKNTNEDNSQQNIDTKSEEDFDYDTLLEFTDCVNSKGLEISIPIFIQDEDSNVQVTFELEGASALEEMPDMNLRTNAIIECERFILEASNNPESIENLMRFLFEVLIMPSTMGVDMGDRPIEAASQENTSPQNPNEGSESLQNNQELNWWDSELVNSQLEVSNTEVCNEYGCITIKTKADRWPDGLIEAEYGISHSSYIGYIDREIKPDNINFNSLSPLEKVARWAAQSTVTVIADRCFDTIGNKIILSTNPYTGFFISNDYVMTHSENLGTLKEKEAAGAYISGDFGDPNGYGGMYNCMDHQENYNNDPVNISGGPEFRVENVEGEGTFIQLFDETFGVGDIVYNKDNIAIIKIQKFTKDVFTPVSSWQDWSVKSSEIIPLPLKNIIEFSNDDVVAIHHPEVANTSGGWFTTVTNLGKCKGNNVRSNYYENPTLFWLDFYSDFGSYGGPILDKDGFVIGMIGGSVSNVDWMCGEVAKSSRRNSLGVLSSFIADSTKVTQVIDSVNLSTAVEDAKNSNTDLLNPSNPAIKETYNWPKNAIVPSSVRYEEIIYDENFTESGFPVSELKNPAFEIAKQATLMFVAETGCASCKEGSTDENFSVTCLCTAFAVTNNLIITNDHCISALSLGDKATFKTYFGQNVEATLIGASMNDGNIYANDIWYETYPFRQQGEVFDFQGGDVALFRTSTSMDLTPVKIGDSSKLKQFDPIISVGHPAIMTRTGPFVVTAGSFVGKSAWADTKQYYQLPAERGASGSGIFNLDGELIGQLCCGGNGYISEQDSILVTKYGLVATEVGTGDNYLNDNLIVGFIQSPKPYLFSPDIPVGGGFMTTDGAPSNYIKELIEKWAPGELDY